MKKQKDMGFELVSWDFILTNGGAYTDWVILCVILFVKDCFDFEIALYA